MFLPSRPIILPFISSFGNATTETVVSAVWSAAQRWIAVLIISLAKTSLWSLIISSYSRMRLLFSTSSSDSSDCINCFFASSWDKPESLSSISNWLFLMLSILVFSSSISLSFSLKFSFFFSKVSDLLSRYSSLWLSLFSCLWTSFRLSRISLSASERSLWISSFASISWAFLVDSASDNALFNILVASCCAEFLSFSAFLSLIIPPITMPKAAKTIATITLTIITVATFTMISIAPPSV